MLRVSFVGDIDLASEELVEAPEILDNFVSSMGKDILKEQY